MSSIRYVRRSPSMGSEPETESMTDLPSTSTSSYNPSETSADRDFVVSGTETPSPRSSSHYSSGNVSDRADERSSPHTHHLKPISILAKRSTTRDGRAATQYLVLWRSWEDTDKIAGLVARGVSTVQATGWF